MGRYRARAWWHVSLGVLVIAGCDPEPAVDGDGHSLGTDTVTTRKTLHVGSVSEFGYGSLHEVTTLRDPGGEIASFGQVSKAMLLDSVVLVSDSRERQTLRVFRLPSGSEGDAILISPEQERFSSFTSDDGSRVIFWERNGPSLWVQGPGSQRTDRVRPRITGNPSNRIHAEGNAVWIWSTVRGDYRTERRSYRAWKISPEGEILQWVDLPDVIRHQPSFVLQTSTGGLRNFPGMHVMDWSPRFGVLYGDNRQYAFTILRDQVAIDVTAAWEPVQLLPDERSWWMEQAARFSARTTGVEYGVPEEKPAFRSLSWDSEGKVWVGRYVEGSRIGTLETLFPLDGLPVVEPVVLDHFSGTGEYLWSIELPHRSRMLDSAGNWILVATRVLQMGNRETITLFQIEPPGGSGRLPNVDTRGM
jgi:hypothetical protein